MLETGLNSCPFSAQFIMIHFWWKVVCDDCLKGEDSAARHELTAVCTSFGFANWILKYGGLLGKVWLLWKETKSVTVRYWLRQILILTMEYFLVYIRATKSRIKWLWMHRMDNITLTSGWKLRWLLTMGIIYLGRKSLCSFAHMILLKIEVRSKPLKTPPQLCGGHTCLILLSLSQDNSISSRGPTITHIFPSSLCVAVAEHCWNPPLRSIQSFGISKTARKGLA